MIICQRCRTPEIPGKIYTKVDGHWICDGCYTGGAAPSIEAGRGFFELLRDLLNQGRNNDRSH